MNVPADARTAADTTAEFFHDYAQDFDAIYGTKHTWIRKLVNKYLRASMRLRFEKTLAGCNPIEGKSVIDIGCGPGHYTVALGQRGLFQLPGPGRIPRLAAPTALQKSLRSLPLQRTSH